MKKITDVFWATSFIANTIREILLTGWVRVEHLANDGSVLGIEWRRRVAGDPEVRLVVVEVISSEVIRPSVSSVKVRKVA